MAGRYIDERGVSKQLTFSQAHQLRQEIMRRGSGWEARIVRSQGGLYKVQSRVTFR